MKYRYLLDNRRVVRVNKETHNIDLYKKRMNLLL